MQPGQGGEDCGPARGTPTGQNPRSPHRPGSGTSLAEHPGARDSWSAALALAGGARSPGGASREHPVGVQAPPAPPSALGVARGAGTRRAHSPSPHLLTRTILGHSCGGTWGGHSDPRIETLRSPPGCLGQGGTGDRDIRRRGPQGAQGETQRGRNIQRGRHDRETGGVTVPARAEPAGQSEAGGHWEAARVLQGGCGDHSHSGVSRDPRRLVSPHVLFDFSPYKLPFDLRKPWGPEPAEPRSPHHPAFTSASASVCSPPSLGRQSLVRVVLG